MTTYDTSTNQLVAVWDTGIGATARTVARLNAATTETVGVHLAQVQEIEVPAGLPACSISLIVSLVGQPLTNISDDRS